MNFKKQYEIMKESFIKIIGLFSSLDGDEKGRRNKIHDVKHRHLIGDYTSYEDPQRIKIIKGLIHSINHYQEINEKELSLDLIKALENYIIDWKEEIRNVSNKQDCENNDNEEERNVFSDLKAIKRVDSICRKLIYENISHKYEYSEKYQDYVFTINFGDGIGRKYTSRITLEMIDKFIVWFGEKKE